MIVGRIRRQKELVRLLTKGDLRRCDSGPRKLERQIWIINEVVGRNMFEQGQFVVMRYSSCRNFGQKDCSKRAEVTTKAPRLYVTEITACGRR